MKTSDCLIVLRANARPATQRAKLSLMMARVSVLVLVFSCTVAAQSIPASIRIGFLSPSTAEGTDLVLRGLRQGLLENGYAEGPSVTLEARFANDQFDRLPALAQELVAVPVDVLVAYVTQASIAAKRATNTIPIVMLGVSDPLASKLVSSLARPGANITGTSAPFSGSAGKGLQLVKEMLPGLTRIAVIRNPDNSVFQAQVLDETRAAARALGIELRLFDARDGDSIDSAFAAISKLRLPAVSVLPDPVLASNWPRIAALSARMRLPSVTVSSVYADAGGLITYGPSLFEMARMTGRYVARILKGANPAELPIEQATRFELVINARTARQIGVTIPQALRLRADRVIE